MSGLKALRNRLRSVKSTQKITKAMRMVAASKLNKSKNFAALADSYKQKIISLLSSAQEVSSDELLKTIPSAIFSEKTEFSNTILIVFGSDRGLCGAYNSNIFKKVKEDLSKYRNPKIIAIGKKIATILSKITKIESTIPSAEGHDIISKKVLDIIENETTKEPATQVLVYFTKFKNALVQMPASNRLIPLDLSSIPKDQNRLNTEFDGKNLLDTLSKIYIKSNIIASLLESKASQEAASMTAMDGATRNAGEMIKRLTLQLNRTRQAVITNELIEVIAGSKAT
ncbi:MAG: ATP synthase F1 subunit gamma [Rickettsiaceae bacterium]|nr:ATP synthase F1 subunit gamma [Rickettsiaceae bacterium]